MTIHDRCLNTIGNTPVVKITAGGGSASQS